LSRRSTPWLAPPWEGAPILETLLAIRADVESHLKTGED
jgi:hypothetical protein